MHHLTIIVLLAAAAQTPAGSAGLPRPVEEVLRSDPGLLYHHKGYVAYLDSHPELAESEQAYTELTRLLDFRRFTAAFDEALLSDTGAGAAFERYHAFLAAYPGTRRAVDDLFRVELESARGNDDLPRAFAFLRAYPDLALRFLAGPERLNPVPADLEDSHAYFISHPETREELRGILLGIHDQTPAHLSVFPWWRMAAQEERAAADAHGRLMGYLSANPHKFWVWHHRQTALAADPHAREWILYWHGRVRRHPDLKDAYWRYLSAVLHPPAPIPGVAAPEDAPEERKPWPPEEDPPPLPPLARDKSVRPGPLSREALIPQDVQPPTGPDLPSVTEPQPPVWPDSPDEPAEPGSTSPPAWQRSEGGARRWSGITAPVRPTPPALPTPPCEKETGPGADAG